MLETYAIVGIRMQEDIRVVSPNVPLPAVRSLAASLSGKTARSAAQSARRVNQSPLNCSPLLLLPVEVSCVKSLMF